MLNRLASQINLMSRSSSSEISDQCLFESSLFPETGSLCQSGGKPVLTKLCAKYLSSPFKIRSASSTARCGFQERFVVRRASTAFLDERSSLRSARKGEFCLRQWAYASAEDGI